MEKLRKDFYQKKKKNLTIHSSGFSFFLQSENTFCSNYRTEKSIWSHQIAFCLPRKTAAPFLCSFLLSLLRFLLEHETYASKTASQWVQTRDVPVKCLASHFTCLVASSVHLRRVHKKRSESCRDETPCWPTLQLDHQNFISAHSFPINKCRIWHFNLSTHHSV